MAVTIPDAANTTQSSWRFCKECFVIYFDGYESKGNCAGGHFEGEGHKAAGWDFFLVTDPENLR